MSKTTRSRGESNTPPMASVTAHFYTVGDCYFDEPGHRGTPLQRQRAATGVRDLAAAAEPRSYVLPAETFVKL